MSTKTDKIQLEMVLKGDPIRAQIVKLQSEAQRLSNEMVGLKKNTAEWVKKNDELKEVQAKIKGITAQLSVNSMTMRELTQRQRELNLQMRNMDPNTPKYAKLKADLTAVNTRMAELRSNTAATQSVLSRMATNFNKFGMMFTAFAASITGASLAFRKLAESVAHMDDVYSDVMKTTGMTRSQVIELNESLKAMDTRTSRESLNNLARDAGKLGITGAKDILAFVDAGNQINVALGEDLGEDAIKNIGKMVNVFQRSDQQLQNIDLKRQMLAVGSAINELGANSTANERYLVDFAGRLGGVASQAGIGMHAIMGFASSLDQDMQKVEMSATALQKFIMTLMAEPSKFATMAGIEVSKFTTLLSTDANAAILQVLRALNQKGGFQQLIPVFQEMGLDGARAVGVLSSLAGSIDQVEESQRIASEAISEATSITAEYDIKNNNLAANLDKARKRFQEVSLELGERLNPALLKSTKSITYLIKLLVELPAFLRENKGIIIAVVSAWTAYAIAVNKTAIATTLSSAKFKIQYGLLVAQNSVLSLGKIAQYGYAAATATMSGNMARANIAMQKLKLSFASTPWGAVLTVITAIGVAVYKWATHQTAAQKAMEEFSKEAATQQAEVNYLFEKLKTLEVGTKEYIETLNRIKTISPDVVQSYLNERGEIENLDAAQKDLISTMEQRIALQLQEQEITKLGATRIQKQSKEMNKIAEKLRNAGVSESEIKDKLSQISTIITQQGKDIAGAGHVYGSELLTSMSDVFTPKQLHTKKGWFSEFISADLADIAKMELEYQNSMSAIQTQFAAHTKETEAQAARRIKAEQAARQKEIEDAQKKAAEEAASKKAIKDAQKEDQREMEQQYKAELDLLQKSLQLQLNVEKERYLRSEITEKEFNANIQAIKEGSLKDILFVTKKYGQDAEKVESDILDTQIKRMEEQQKLLEAALKGVSDSLRKIIDEDEAYAEESWNKQLDEIRKFKSEREKVLQHFDIENKNLQEQYQAELDLLKDSHAKGLLAEKEYQKALRELKMRSLTGYLEASESLTGNFIQMTQGMEKSNTARVEAEYAARIGALTYQYNQGIISQEEYNEQKKQLDYEQKVEELEIQKKYANANFGLQVANILVTGLQSAMQAFSAMASIPIIGPILGGAAAAAVGIMTAAQISQANSERKKILSTSIESPASSGTSSVTTGVRIPNVEQAAEGRYDVIGKDDGKLYRNIPYGGSTTTGILQTPTLVAEQGSELIVDNKTLRSIKRNAPHVIDEIMYHKVRQRAEGNYSNVKASSSNSITVEVINELMQNLQTNQITMLEVVKLLEWLQVNKIEAAVIYQEFEKKRALFEKSAARARTK